MHINNINTETWIFLYLLYLVFDIVYVKYILAAQNLKSFSASNYSFCLCIMVAFGIISYVDNILNVIPVAFGSWCGTFVTLQYEKYMLKKKIKKKPSEKTQLPNSIVTTICAN